MATRQLSVSLTSDALVIRIPWTAIEVGHRGSRMAKRHLTARDVLDLVEAGRLAHQVGKTRVVRSLKALAS